MNDELKRKLDMLNAKDSLYLEKKYGKGFCYIHPLTGEKVYEKTLADIQEKGDERAVALSKQLHKVKWSPKNGEERIKRKR